MVGMSDFASNMPLTNRPLGSIGAFYAAKGDNGRANEDYGGAIRPNPNYASAFNNRGLAYNAKGQMDRPIEDYTRAIELNPGEAKTFNNRWFTYRDKGEYDRAIEDYDEAIRLDPNYAIAFNNSGFGLRRQGLIRSSYPRLRPGDQAQPKACPSRQEADGGHCKEK